MKQLLDLADVRRRHDFLPDFLLQGQQSSMEGCDRGVAFVIGVVKVPIADGLQISYWYSSLLVLLQTDGCGDLMHCQSMMEAKRISEIEHLCRSEARTLKTRPASATTRRIGAPSADKYRIRA